MKLFPRVPYMHALLVLCVAVFPTASFGASINQSFQLTEKRFALVIGNGDYKTLPKLGNPRNDAKDMCASLSKLRFDALCFENLRTKREMKDAVIRFAEKLRGNDGIALFFYAGHGIQIKGQNYLIPSDAELRTEADVEDEALNISYLMSQLDSSQNPFSVVILDACRNDPISRGWRSVTRGLAPVDAPSGSVIIFSTAPGQAAFDGNGRNGLFTKHLLARMSTPGLPLEEMIKQVSRGVSEESRNGGITQTPWWNSSFTGNFCFAGCTDAAEQGRLESVRLEKRRLEEEIQRMQRESAERQALLFRQETQFKIRQTELEQLVRKLEEQAKAESSKSAPVMDELLATRKQLLLLQSERKKQDQTQRLQSEELRQLTLRRQELDRKDAEMQEMARKLVELEKEKRDRELQLEAAQNERTVPAAPTESKPVRHEIPPAL